MNNPFQITFTLKQHTPLIHFQHDQQGATLRATELKPKLDRFIIEKCLEELDNPKVKFNHPEEARNIFKTIALSKGNNFKHYKPEWKEWLIGKGKKKIVSFTMPANSDAWYLSIGQGMGKTVTYADEKQVYTMSDRGTYIKYKYGKIPAIELEVLCEGGRDLANPYGIIPVNPGKYPHVRHDLAMKFVTWITSEKGQKMIDGYRLEGKQLFYPDAL